MSRKKVIAFGCWNNEMPISVKGRAGALHPVLFMTEALAREYYQPKSRKNCDDDDVIVRVTCEVIESSEPQGADRGEA